LTQSVAAEALASAPREATQAHGSIVLVRHGRPALSRKVRLDWRGYRTWWAAYGESKLAPGQEPPEELRAIAATATKVLASPLPRAFETASQLAPGTPIVVDDLFVEAPLPAPQIPYVRWRPGTWNVYSRVFWLFGYSASGESHKHAEVRAVEAAGRLEELARGENLVLLCAHGWFNRMIRKVLRARGWRCVYDGGDSYWAWRRYEPPAG
jgi:broad specificity phosphatase PhoE